MWMGVTRLAPLVDVPDDFSEAVFGFSKRAVTKPEDFNPIAGGSGDFDRFASACGESKRVNSDEPIVEADPTGAVLVHQPAPALPQ